MLPSGREVRETRFGSQLAAGPSRGELTLLVAGCRGGKSSFLRLLIDTSEISQAASKEQLQSVARFIQGCNSHTSSLRTASIDINVDGSDALALTVVDTPSLDFSDNIGSERVVADTLHFIESRLAEGGEDDSVAQSGDRYVHLCVYFLDPDHILPPSLPAPATTRARGNSFAQPDQDTGLLDLPVNPLLSRPTLPLAEISTIRRLSARVNVLPVIARADSLSNERLASVKRAIRRDLADHGIGFGIFDVDSYEDASNSPPASPASSASLLRLPYALLSPDIYSHSDGVQRTPLSRHELLLQYTPSPLPPPSKRNLLGKFIRSYRWGTVDALDPAHSDFVSLRTAIFHHMKTLQKYTREYLFDKFRIECLPHRANARPASHSQALAPPSTPLSLGPRPILAIDTAPRSAVPHRGSTHSTAHREIALTPDVQSARLEPSTSAYPAKASSSGWSSHARHFFFGSLNSQATGTVKPRSKKITVACNFCRSRKLKCDGGRPSCAQCLKRNNPCDYMPQNKRRGGGGAARVVKGEESDSESADDRSPDPSLSPEISSRRGSNFETSPAISLLGDRRDELPPITAYSSSGSGEQQPSPTTPGPMSAPSLQPLRQASEQQQRKRSATVPGKSTRLPSTTGPKVVACNFCRARKTKCDGATPQCSSCVRRMLPCNYVHDPNSNGQRKTPRKPSTSKESMRSISPASTRPLPAPSSANYEQDMMELDLKRSLEHSDAGRPSPPKKIKTSSLEIP
ncbi:GTP binding protein [Mycena indigotica]|uniref:GTP binding protein n=1 Tax=Mycena indigotica TaxID=2126181 RepID=A0A8H6SG69_9AGAR|nr:GTP binding protein [Mycena indigotica]KAF7298963.1 GTP binding protein [Mycena indigotica]